MQNPALVSDATKMQKLARAYHEKKEILDIWQEVENLRQQLLQLEQDVTPPDETIVRSCSACGHISICAVLRAVAGLLGSFEEENRPFEPEAMGVICTKWISLAAVEVLQGDHR